MTYSLETITSPYNTVQEAQIGHPYGVWRILVVCQLLNQTHGRQVRPMIDELFDRWPSPQAMRLASPTELKELLRPLGFQERRFRTLRTMSAQYDALRANDRGFWKSYEDGSWCKQFAGCGDYAAAALDVVVYGKLDNPTGDHWLERYRLWRIDREDLRARQVL